MTRYLRSTIVVVQSITIGMTLFKHVVAIRLGWGRTPLLSFLVRDATSNYVTIFRELSPNRQLGVTDANRATYFSVVWYLSGGR